MAQFEIDLNTIHVIEKEDRSNDEAYIWCFGILVDATTKRSGNYVIQRSGSKYNLGDDFRKGEKRTIPDSTGKVSCKISHVPGMGAIVGIIAIMWEGDNTPNDTVLKAYKDVATEINDFVKNLVKQGKTSLGKADMDRLYKEIKAAVAKNVKETLSIFRPLRLDVDDYIGNGVSVFPIPEKSGPLSNSITFDGKEDDAHYRLTGKFSYTP